MPLGQHQELVRAYGLDAPRAGRRDQLLTLFVGSDEHFARCFSANRVFVDKEHPAAARRLLELAGQHALQVTSLLKTIAQSLRLLVRPGPCEQSQQRNHQQDRPDETKQRPHKTSQTASAGEPDHHFTVAVHARERADNGDEKAQRENGWRMAQHGVPQHHHHFGRVNTPAGCQPQRAYKKHGHHDGRQHDHRGTKGATHFLAD